MNRIPDNFYYGNLCPSEKSLVTGSSVEKAHATFHDNAIQLEQVLSGKEKELFKVFAEASQELCENFCCEYFSDGLRLGARMMLEVVKDDVTSFLPPERRHV